MIGKIARCTGKTISDKCIENETRTECALLAGGGTAALLLSHGIFSCSNPTSALMTGVKLSTIALNTSLGERIGGLVYRLASGVPQGRGERDRILGEAEQSTPPLANAPTPGSL